MDACHDRVAAPCDNLSNEPLHAAPVSVLGGYMREQSLGEAVAGPIGELISPLT